MAQSTSKFCDICMSGLGRNICDQCDQWMCENCKTLHLRSKISRNHTFLSGSNINPEDKPFCKEHDENFIFYCIDCHMPICKMCSVKKHKKHDMSEINELTQELQAEVKKVMDSKMKSVTTSLDKIAQGMDKYHSDIIEAIRTITEDGNQMKLWIDTKVQALIASLKEKETAKLKALESIKTGFQNELGKLTKYKTAFTESQRLDDVTKLLTKLKNIKSELDAEGEQQLLVTPTVKYNRKNVSERELFKLFGDIFFQETVNSVDLEQTPKKETSVQLTKTMYRYKCSYCGKKSMSQSNGDELYWCGCIEWSECTS